MAITDNLIAYWKLDEVSGSRADSVGANTLTDNNTVTQGVGVVANAAQFTAASSEYLSRADNAALSTGDIDYTLGGWGLLDSNDGSTIYQLAGKGNSTTVREYLLRYVSSTSLWTWTIYNAAGTSMGSITSSLAMTIGTWHFIASYHDAANNLIGISVDGAPFSTTGTSGAPADTAASFRIGATNTTPTGFWDGRIDEVWFFKRVITDAEVAFLYNNGQGRPYPFAIGPIPYALRSGNSPLVRASAY